MKEVPTSFINILMLNAEPTYGDGFYCRNGFALRLWKTFDTYFFCCDRNATSEANS
jgi:hypothetical protein